MIISALLAIPITGILAKNQDNLNKQRSANQQLQLRIESDLKIKQKQQEQIKAKDHQIKDKDDNIKSLQLQVKAKQDAIQLAAQTAPAPSVVVHTASCEQYRPLVAQYPWNVDIALAIMQAESGCNADARHVNNNGSVDHGLFQLNNIDVEDPAENIHLAYVWKYEEHGWQPWTTFTSGAYLRYLQ